MSPAIAEWMGHLLLPGQNVEIRGIGKTEREVEHYLATPDGFAALEARALEWDARGLAVYWVPNPVPIGLNRPARDSDILEYRWLLIDVEPRRKTPVASTEAEKALSLEMLQDLIALFQGLGVHDVATADSGNGYHLLIPFNCPNTQENKELASQVLHGLDHRWSTDRVKIDPVTFNPSRLVRLYGTTNRKGDHTEDRPHRQSRFLTRPLEYSGEAGYQGCKALLARWAAQARMIEESREPCNQTQQSSAMDRAKAYLRKADPAIEGQGGSNECYRLACVLTNGYALSADEAYEAFQEWNQTCVPPWSEKELRHKIDDSIKANNHQKPRGYLLTEGRATSSSNPAAVPSRNGVHKEATAGTEGEEEVLVNLKPMTEYELRPVEYLARPYLPRGKLVIVAGNGGIGKTTFVRCICASMSRGLPLLDGYDPPEEPCGTVWFSQEEAVSDTIGPAYLAAGGDPTRFLMIEGLTNGAPFTLHHLGALGKALDRVTHVNPRVMVIDPITGLTGATGADGNTESEIRPLLEGLARMAEERGMTVLGLIHLNKASESQHRLLGSVAFETVPRMVLAVGNPDEDEGLRHVVQYKCNLPEPPPGMKFRVRKLSPDERDVVLAGHVLTQKQKDDFDRQLVRVVWDGQSDRNRTDVLAGPPKKKPPSPAVQNAVEWLRERLATGPERLKVLREEADNLPEPINANSLYKAADLLKLSVTKVSGQTIWELPRCEGEVQDGQ